MRLIAVSATKDLDSFAASNQVSRTGQAPYSPCRQRRITSVEPVKDELPPVRKTAKISVSFSKREFSTPSRESYKEQEDEVSSLHLLLLFIDRIHSGWPNKLRRAKQ